MGQILHVIASLATVAWSVFLVPWVLVRALLPGAGLAGSFAASGMLALFLHGSIPVALHLSAIPVSRPVLLLVHAAVSLVAGAAFLVRRPGWKPPAGDTDRTLVGIIIVFCLLILPFTRLAGIDTYKWQGLATNVAVEAAIPWLVHPLSLLGFTPRAYPSAQPLALASIQIIGDTGVDWGFYFFSVLSLLIGASGSLLLGKALFTRPDRAAWLCALYVFSPVFTRYNHWATGRGLFLSVFVLMLACALSLRVSKPARLCLVACALLLPFTHKVGLAGLVIGLLLGVSCLVLPRLRSPVFMGILTLPFVLLAMILSAPRWLPGPAGLAGGFTAASITRFGWMIPVAAVGILCSPHWLTDRRRRALVLPMLLTLPLAYPRDMYGAMLALPFVCAAAATGFFCLQDRFHKHIRLLSLCAALLTLAGCLAIILNRNLAATPPRVYRAAMALEAYDPTGPFRVHAPGRARVQIHAYVSGCPRFTVTPGTNSVITFRTPPSLSGPPQDVAVNWIDYGRNFFTIPELATDWYGADPRHYYITIDGTGDVPHGGAMIYDADDIRIYVPPGQPRPADKP